MKKIIIGQGGGPTAVINDQAAGALYEAKKYDLKVIEDCCEAHGAKYKGKYIGTIGDMGVFSFYVAHVVVCGEGGMVVTNNDRIANAVRSVKTYGRPTRSVYFDFQRFGLNLRMNDLTAAIGIEGIEHYNETRT